jgi:hypothetical protein
MKIRSLGAELFHADGQTWTKLIVAFRNFANAPERTKRQIIAIQTYFLTNRKAILCNLFMCFIIHFTLNKTHWCRNMLHEISDTTSC